MKIQTELHEKFTRLQWLLQKQQMKRHTHGRPLADTSKGQGRILAFLKLKDGISTKDLSYLLGIRVSSLNESLVRLEKSGYITRKHSAEDKRVILIYLTEKGREEEEPEREESCIFDCLNEEEQVKLGEYLDRMIDSLEADLGPGEDDEDMFSWMDRAREKMGEERFEELMAMRHMHGGFGHGRSGGRGHGFHSHDGRGRDGFGGMERQESFPHKHK